jgi:glycosyltransferase involved in cell wall biosynthesis
VPEIIEHGMTGFVVDNLSSAVQAVERVGSLSRQVCRDIFENRFSARRMSKDYLTVYNRLLEEGPEMILGADTVLAT